VPEETYGKKFEFIALSKEYGQDTINIPTHEDLKNTGGIFDIDDFLAKYVEYFNGELREEKIESITNLPKVKEVKVNA